jgi:hypothetical protein
MPTRRSLAVAKQKSAEARHREWLDSLMLVEGPPSWPMDEARLTLLANGFHIIKKSRKLRAALESTGIRKTRRTRKWWRERLDALREQLARQARRSAQLEQ